MNKQTRVAAAISAAPATLLILTACRTHAESGPPATSVAEQDPTPVSAPFSSTFGSAPDPVSVYVVTKVVDGGTVDVVGAAEATMRIRVIGIDTPEMSTCEGQAAKDAMSALVMGNGVILTAVPSKDDTVRYGRFLRGKVDLNAAGLHSRHQIGQGDDRPSQVRRTSPRS